MIFRYEDKIIGKYEDGVFTKTVEKSKHFMRKNQSWGMDLNAFNTLPSNCTIRLFDKESNRSYEATWRDFRDKGTIENYGYGKQIFLNINNFKIIWHTNPTPEVQTGQPPGTGKTSKSQSKLF